MAFAIRNLSVLAYANGFTLWHYRGAHERFSTIAGIDYFSDAADMLAPGDIIMVSAIGYASLLAVAPPDRGAVITVPFGESPTPLAVAAE